MWNREKMRSVLGQVSHKVSTPKCQAVEEAYSLRIQEGTFLPKQEHGIQILPTLCPPAQAPILPREATSLSKTLILPSLYQAHLHQPLLV